MKVILLQDVAKLGKRFETVEVPAGHGLNMLIPKGLAEAATPENEKRIAARKDKATQSATEAGEVFASAMESLGEEALTVTVEANEQGHLFEALKPATVVSALAERKVEVQEDQIVIANPIKEVGSHSITLTSGADTHTCVVEVVAA